jgi:hypothetical protein
MAFTPAIILALLCGLPSAGCAWASGRRRLASVGVLAAVLPSTFILVESRDFNLAVAVALIAAFSWLFAWLTWLRHPVMVQANISLQADRER